MLKSLSIKHYRGVFDEETAHFAEPNGKKGSGLTVFVGPNNTGKTTFIEALLIEENKIFKESERHKDEDPIIKVESSDETYTYTNNDRGSQIRREKPRNGKLSFEHISSRRHWGPYAVKKND